MKTQKNNEVLFLADANPENPCHFLTQEGQQAQAQLLEAYPQGVERDRLVFGKWVDESEKETPDTVFVNQKPNADFANLIND